MTHSANSQVMNGTSCNSTGKIFSSSIVLVLITKEGDVVAVEVVDVAAEVADTTTVIIVAVDTVAMDMEAVVEAEAGALAVAVEEVAVEVAHVAMAIIEMSTKCRVTLRIATRVQRTRRKRNRVPNPMEKGDMLAQHS